MVARSHDASTRPAKRLGLVVTATLMAVAVLAAPADAKKDDPPQPVGAVYIASNSYAGNQILTFDRFADGTLQPGTAPVATEGLGSGPSQVPLLTADPLGSQHSLVVDQDSGLLFVTNAGSDDLSVFDLHRHGPTLVGRYDTGAFPVGVAVHDRTVYVLNAIDHSVTGFLVDPEGVLTNLDTCPLPPLPGELEILDATEIHSRQPVVTETAGQIGFSPDGAKLLVVSKEGSVRDGSFPFGGSLGDGRIHVFDVDDKTRTLVNCADPATTVLPSNADGKPKFPFAFAWSSKGHLLVTEVFGTTTFFGGSSLSSYTLQDDGSLTPISVSIGNGRSAMCWVITTRKHAYVTNFVESDLSSYTVSGMGELELLAATASESAAEEIDHPIDMALTDDGRYLYQLSPGNARIVPFEISPTGALQRLPSVLDGLAANSGQAGIATYDYDD